MSQAAGDRRGAYANTRATTGTALVERYVLRYASPRIKNFRGPHKMRGRRHSGDVGRAERRAPTARRGHKKSQPDRLPLRLAALPRLTIITHTHYAHVHAKKTAKLQLFFDIRKYFCIFLPDYVVNSKKSCCNFAGFFA